MFYKLCVNQFLLSYAFGLCLRSVELPNALHNYIEQGILHGFHNFEILLTSSKVILIL